MGKTSERPSYRAWREANRERIAANKKAWVAANPDKVRQYRDVHRTERNAAALAAARADPETWNARSKASRRRLRERVIAHYGGSCACCGESHFEFLAIDHIEGGGNKHRAETGCRSGTDFCRWLVKNGFPDGYRVLCHNCNMALGSYGYCPHQSVAVAVS